MIATIVQLLPVIILLLGDLRVTYSFPMHRTTRLSCPFTRSTRNFSSKNALILPRDPDDRPIQTIAAPMVAASDYAFRCLCRQYGVDLTFTQMIHATNLLANKQFGRNHLDLWEYTTPKQSEWSRVQLELFEERSHSDSGENPKSRSPLFQKSTADMSFITGPTIVQLAGHEPATVVKAAQRILEHTDGKVHGFDLNLGKQQLMSPFSQNTLLTILISDVTVVHRMPTRHSTKGQLRSIPDGTGPGKRLQHLVRPTTVSPRNSSRFSKDSFATGPPKVAGPDFTPSRYWYRLPDHSWKDAARE